ncbi:MAG: response regulator [Gemmataceae bacterium]
MQAVVHEPAAGSEMSALLNALIALKKGKAGVRLPAEWTGVAGKVADAFNEVVELNERMAGELERLSRVVGKEGKLSTRASLGDVRGFWQQSVECVNDLIDDLVHPTSETARVIGAVAQGDLSQTMALQVEDRPLQGEFLRTAKTINTMVEQLSSFASEVTRVAREVGTEGKLGGQAAVKGVAGTWKDLTDSVNMMAGNLTGQVRNIAEVATAVANGDLSKKITVDVKGEILQLKNTINTMVDQLRSFASEVTRVAREVGTEGKLGGQAKVDGVSGTWKDLTDSVNMMAANLTGQVRGIAKVVTAVANGDLKRKLTVDAKGEIAELADTINSMIDTLATFADQVTTVAREVGVEGQLGGQAKVPGAAGTWKGLTENVNQLAANLTTQVRAIADVATAVTKGDLTRSITVEALGEVAALKDTINEMIRNLRDTTQKNTEQDWLKTNLAKFSRMLQGQRNLTHVGRMVLSELCPVVEAQLAEFYVLDAGEGLPYLKLLASYGSDGQESLGKRVGLGEGLVGQCALEKRPLLMTNVPPGYLRISSGLGSATPRSVLVLPIIFEGQVRGVLELASFGGFNPSHEALLDQLTESIGIVLNTIEANMRTEDLLKQSQSLAQQLQTRQEELQNTNEELQEKARLLAHQNQEVERKNQEVEQARQALEEKAKQLALTSKYKSEFLANMSHELRTPLNSLLILSDQLCKNPEGNLTGRQTEFAKTIHSSGNDLLMLINDILDLSKIESGTVVVDAGELRLDDLRGFVERTFRHIAEAKNVGFALRFTQPLPPSIFTDAKRLQQIIKNLLSNAFKFTHHGQVTLNVQVARSGWSADNEELARAGEVLAFQVSDTGIGIAQDKQQIIFEAFQQADGSTSRKYGGTGLGLAISRELSRLLGGEIRLSSTPGRGSTFTLYLPTAYSSLRGQRKLPAGTDLLDPPTAPTRLQALPPPEGRNGPPVVEEGPGLLVNEVGDDRDDVRPGDRVLLVVENDTGFARFLLETARERGFKVLVTSLGAAALALSRDYMPEAITLDIHLPDIDGWRVMERLKNDLATRHIPVCVISTDDSRERALASGALAFLTKPLRSRDALDALYDHVKGYNDRPARQLLLIDPHADRRARLRDLLAGDDVEVTAVAEPPADGPRPDCVILAGASLDAGGPALAAREEADGERLAQLPVLVYGEEAINQAGAAWKRLASACTVRQVRSPERLLDLASFFLHRRVTRVPEEKRHWLLELHQSDKALAGKKVLIVDDDMRNIFALSSVLEEHDMRIVSADNGRDAITALENDPQIDIVLMDIMMPEMDGLETMREIRKVPRLKGVPIVAVTAKAMKGDREKCIEAGAWDYLSKPVDTEQMLAVLRAWLHR